MGIRIENLHFHLHGGFRPVGLRRDFCDDSIPLEIRICIHGDHAFLLRTQPGEIVLCDIEFHLKIVQIGQGDDQALRTALGGAGKSRGHQFALFGCALKNRSGHWRADYGSVEQRLGIVRLSLSLLQRAAGARNLLLAGTDLGQLKRSCPANLPVAGRLQTLRWRHREPVSRARPVSHSLRVRSRVILSSASVARASSRLCCAC